MADELTRLKEIEKQKLADLWAPPPDVVTIKEEALPAAPESTMAPRGHTGDLNPWSIVLTVTVLFILFGAVASGGSIWSYWWLIFLIKPLAGRCLYRC